MAVQGLRGLESITTDGQRPKNWREKIIQLWPNGATPLFALTNGLKSESTDDPEYSWFQKEFQEQRLSLAADVAGAPGVAPGDPDTLTINSDASAFTNLKRGHVLMIEATGELVRVLADPPANNDVDVVRGVGMAPGGSLVGVTLATPGTNPRILVVGTAHPEGDTTPTPISWDPVKYRNYTQIFRDSLGSTRTAQKTRYRTGDIVTEMRRETLEQHSVAIERALIFGQPSELVNGPNGHPLRTTGGVLSFLTGAGRVHDFLGSADMEALEEELYEVFRYGSTEKMAFCGGRLLIAIGRIVRRNADWQWTGGKEFGMNVTRLICPFGSLVFKNHPLLTIMRGGTVGGTAYHGYEASAFILDMEALKYRYLRDSDTKYLPKRQDNGLDGDLSEYLTECGLEIHQAKRHRVWINLADGLADTPPGPQ